MNDERQTSDHPPAPWHLRGDMYGAVLRIATRHIPAQLLPASHIVGRRRRTRLIVTAWVDYRDGGVLAYRELMVAIITRLRPPIRGTLVKVWVNSPPAMIGGRQLWRIPKELGEFDLAHDGEQFTASLLVNTVPQATYRFRSRRTLPVRWSSGLQVVQAHGTGTRSSLGRITGTIEYGTGTLTVEPGGALAFLRHGTPVTHLAVRDFRMVAGRRTTDRF
ncbi:acetoacetate decarboxylase family protein [Amycolatopsis sp. NPDC051071]|uniref:acetoacetate decarboxylase family protein n=1 Tax=Amycolatopsis sp. NPDC051071 TaxID=3154637 RepID=UPI0034275B8D